VQIDTKLKWGPHVKKLQEKATRLTNAFTALSASTWGATFTRARHIYTAVVRPALLYGAPVWHDLREEPKHNKIIKGLNRTQNKCLRIIAGAYKATNQAELENETHIPSIKLYADSTVMRSALKTEKEVGSAIINKECGKIRARLQPKRGRRRTAVETPAQRTAAIAKRTLRISERQPDSTRSSHRDTKTIEERVKDHLYSSWREKWKQWQSRQGKETPAQQSECDKRILRLRAGVSKAESTLSTLIRTEKIGLRDFLYRRRVPGITSSACVCGWSRQTAKHIVMHCPEYREERQRMWRTGGSMDYRTLTSSRRGLKAIACWMMRRDILPQFRLAKEMLDEEERLRIRVGERQLD
jgi:hypothetical protein